jgi:hypothetical protein
MTKFKNLYFYLIIYLLVYVFFALLSPYFWFDEAGQIYMSLGLNHFSPPNSPLGSIGDVILNNNKYNLDPGGFSVILFVWLKASTNYIWVRILPYLFFIISIFLLTKISKSLFSNINSYFFGIAVFLIPQLVFRSTEIRAYSMDFLSIIFSIYIVINLAKLNDKHLFFTSILASFLITSRYSSVVLYGIVALIFIFTIFFNKKLSISSKLKSSTYFLLPLLITVCIIYLVTLCNQNPNLTKISYAGYLIDNTNLLFENFNWIHLLSISFLTLVYKYDNKLPSNFKTFVLSSLLINFVFISLSFMGVYPYCPFDERNLAIFTYTYLPIVFWFTNKNIWLTKYINYPFIPLLFAILFTVGFNKILSTNWRRNNLYNDLLVNKISSNSIVFVEKDLIPSTKYLFEFTTGDYNYHYPKNFIFLDDNLFTVNQKSINSSKDIYLISNRIIVNSKYSKIGNSLYKVSLK